MGYYSFYRIIKDILYNLKKNKILVVIAIIILILFLCNNVFASIISYTLKSGNEDAFTLNVDIPNHILNINNVSVASGVWDYDNMAFVNPANNSAFIIVWNGNLIIKNNDAFFCDTNFRCLSFTYFMENLSSVHSIARPFNYYINTNNYRVGDKQLFNPNNYVFSTADIYDNNGNVIIKNNNIKYPQITNSLEDLQTLNFDTISVSAWDWSNKDLYILFYDRTLMNNNDTQGLYPKKEIKLTTNTSYYIPEISSEENAIYWIANDNTGLNFKVGGKYEIRLAERVPQSTGGGFRGDDLYSYNYLGDSVQFEISENVSAEKIKDLNEQTKANEEKERHDETIGAINNQTQATQDLNNSITDSNVTTDIELPSDTTENPTENGLNNIFDLIYNGFTQGQAQDIVFPIPFTNKSLKIEPNYLQQALTNNNAQWVITIIQAFWWYLISRFIIKDITKKIRKIKSGNIEDIQNNNIKEDML